MNYTPSTERYNSGMDYRRAGHSGVLLSALSLGLWHNFGTYDSFDTARAMMCYAFDSGITSFDLANNYGPPEGSAEETFGKLLDMDFRPYRDELFISTKAGHDMWQGPYGTWGGRKHLFASLHQSLKRMRVDYVDVFYSHRYDPHTPLEETLQALIDIVRQGKALYVGISKYPPQEAAKAYAYLRHANVPCLLHQGRLSMLNRTPAEDGTLTQAQEAGSGFVAFSSLAQGLLTNRYLQGTVPADSRMSRGAFLKQETLTSDLLARLQQLNDLAQERGETLAGLALAWVLHFKAVTSVVLGASRVEQLKDSLKSLSATPLSEEELIRIENILK